MTRRRPNRRAAGLQLALAACMVAAGIGVLVLLVPHLTRHTVHLPPHPNVSVQNWHAWRPVDWT